MRLRKTRSVKPHESVAQLKARVFNGASDTVKRPRPSEDQHMAAGLEHLEHSAPGLGPESYIAAVPFFAHEACR